MIKTPELDINRLTLSLPPKQEQRYQTEDFRNSLRIFRFSFLSVTVLYGLFGILDTLMVPQYQSLFFSIRFLVVVPFLLAVLGLSYYRVFLRIRQGALFASFLVAGFGIVVMIVMAPGNIPYYGGLMLIFSAGYFFIKLRFIYAAIAGWIIVLGFNIAMVLFSEISTADLISVNFFYVSANLLNMFAAYYIEYFHRRNYCLAVQLDKKTMELQGSNLYLEAEIKARTHALTVSEKRYRQLVEEIQDVIFSLDAEGNFTYISPALERHTGFSSIDFLGKHIASIVIPDDEPVVMGGLVQLQTGDFYDGDFRIRSASGEVLWARSSVRKIVGASGLVEYRGIAHNITERKKVEIELIQAKERAEESDRLKSSFLANMSHEIRTPMNGIMGFISLLQDSELTGEEKAEYARIVKKSGDRLLNTIHDIIDLSKIEAGLAPVVLSEVNIHEITEKLQASFLPEAGEKGLKLVLHNEVTHSKAVKKTDKEKLNAVLTNLIKNSLKYTLKGTVEWGCRDLNDRIVFFVKDTGIGIHESKIHKIFDRFIQADYSNNRIFEGSGLGLSISKAYVEMLGGTIGVESREGVGTVFSFHIPAQGMSKKMEYEAPVMEERAGTDQSSLHILVSEDDEVNYNYIRILLTRAGHRLSHAADGLQAVELCRQGPPFDLILMDIRLPEMDGFQATREIRKFNPTIPIIALTAYTFSDDQSLALQAGCNDFLPKPMKREDLFNAISRNCIIRHSNT